ncbi:hypothetical protein O6H91_Y389700 [Diphasiastrum complanatum]|nr:hypothetical protein O6H91_Y389700 [Diphasiastrum complanatum]
MLGAFLLPSPTPLAPPSAPNKYDKGADNLGFLRGLQGKQKQMIKKFVNICMADGKKTKARALVYETFQHLAVRGDVVTILDKAVENVRPICEVKRVRIAGVTHNVPSTIAKHRQETLALRWLLEAAVKRRSSKKSLSVGQCLCDEILDASQKTGMARKKRDDLHKLAEVNRTFAHYRWW